MKSRPPTPEEHDFLNYSAQVPCIVCELYHFAPDTPAEIHHIHGKTVPNAHMRVLSLCTRHHRRADTNKPKRWVSRHGDGKQAFEQAYKPEIELLKIQRERVESLRLSFVGAEYVD